MRAPCGARSAVAINRRPASPRASRRSGRAPGHAPFVGIVPTPHVRLPLLLEAMVASRRAPAAPISMAQSCRQRRRVRLLTCLVQTAVPSRRCCPIAGAAQTDQPLTPVSLRCAANAMAQPCRHCHRLRLPACHATCGVRPAARTRPRAASPTASAKSRRARGSARLVAPPPPPPPAIRRRHRHHRPMLLPRRKEAGTAAAATLRRRQSAAQRAPAAAPPPRLPPPNRSRWRERRLQRKPRQRTP